VPHDQDLRAAEERRRCEILERGRELGGVLVAPQRPPRPRTPGGQQTRTEDAERAVDEVRLLAVQQVVGPERVALERRQRIGRRAAAGAQKPSIVCR
jgi:hypothetical protein